MAANDCCAGCCCGPEIGQPGQPGEQPGAKYAKTFRSLGITQTVLGSFSIVFGTILLALSGVTIDFSYGFAWVSTGIWCGLMFLAAGILGIKSATYPNQCMITASLVVTIFAALLATSQVALGIQGAIFASGYYPWYEPYQYPLTYRDAQVAFHSLLAVFGFAELVVSITHSSYCCASNCCRSVSTTTTTTYVTTIPGQGPVVTAPNQYGVSQYQYVVQGQSNPGFNNGVPQMPRPDMPAPVAQPGYQEVQQPQPDPVQSQPSPTPPPEYTEKVAL